MCSEFTEEDDAESGQEREDSDGESEPCCKLGEMVEKYDIEPPSTHLGSVNDYLESEWLGVRGERRGYRALSRWVNREIVRTVYQEHSIPTRRSKIETDVEILRQNDEYDESDAESLKVELKGEGVDAEELEKNLISYFTVKTHLSNCLGHDPENVETIKYHNPGKDNLQRTIGHIEEYLNEKLEDFANTARRSDHLPGIEEAQIQYDITIVCPECPTRVSIRQAVKQGYICEDHKDLFEGEQDASDDSTDDDTTDDEQDTDRIPADQSSPGEMIKAFRS